MHSNGSPSAAESSGIPLRRGSRGVARDEAAPSKALRYLVLPPTSQAASGCTVSAPKCRNASVPASSLSARKEVSAMAKIHGTYEYNDDLTPGKKKEGGLHQNLFDSDGNLKGSARFIPDEGQDDSELEPVFAYEPVYLYDEEYERRREREREENAELVA